MISLVFLLLSAALMQMTAPVHTTDAKIVGKITVMRGAWKDKSHPQSLIEGSPVYFDSVFAHKSGNIRNTDKLVIRFDDNKHTLKIISCEDPTKCKSDFPMPPVTLDLSKVERMPYGVMQREKVMSNLATTASRSASLKDDILFFNASRRVVEAASVWTGKAPADIQLVLCSAGKEGTAECPAEIPEASFGGSATGWQIPAKAPGLYWLVGYREREGLLWPVDGLKALVYAAPAVSGAPSHSFSEWKERIFESRWRGIEAGLGDDASESAKRTIRRALIWAISE